jgi:hypothetical protein
MSVTRLPGSPDHATPVPELIRHARKVGMPVFWSEARITTDLLWAWYFSLQADVNPPGS